jgi:hypothetical protein
LFVQPFIKAHRLFLLSLIEGNMAVNESAFSLGSIVQVLAIDTTKLLGAVQRPLYGVVQSDGSLALQVAVVSGGGGGGGGGPVAPTAAGTSASTANPIQGVTGGIAVPVSGTFWQSIQPISGTVSANAGTGFPATSAAGTSAASLWTVQGSPSAVPIPISGTVTVSGGGGPVAPTTAGTSASTANPIQGVTGGVAVTVIATSLPLPAGAATAANQPSLTTAGTSGVNLVTVQGSNSGVAIPVTTGSPSPTSGTILAINTGVSCTIPAGCTGLQYALTGTWVGTLALQSSYDNVNWVSINDVTSTSLYTTNKTSVVLTAPYQYFRIYSTAYVSGTASVSLQPVSNLGANVTVGSVNAGTGFPSTTSAGTSGSSLTTVQGSPSGVAIPVSIVSNSTVSNVAVYTAAGTTSTNANPIQGVNGGIAVPVSGTFWQTTQPVSLAASVAVTGTFWQATQPISIATMPALVTSTAAIGQIGGKTTTVDVTPTISTSAYTAGYVVGGLLTFSNALLTAGTGILQSITLKCKTVQTVGFKLYLFKTNPTNSTWTDHAAPAINAADIPFVTSVRTLSSPDSGLGTHTIYVDDGIGKVLNPGATTLYGILITTGTPTFTSTSDMTISIGILQD